MTGPDPVLHAVAVAALVALWLHAGTVKLRDRLRFEGALAGYRLVPGALVLPASLVLPVLELLLAAGLVWPASRPAAALGSALLLALYAVAIAINLARGRGAIDCGCGGTPRPLHPWLVGRNLVLAGVSLALLVPTAARELVWLDGASAALALAAAVGLHATLEQWLHNAQAMRIQGR